MIILFKYCANMENCENFQSFGYICILVKFSCGAQFYHKLIEYTFYLINNNLSNNYYNNKRKKLFWYNNYQI